MVSCCYYSYFVRVIFQQNLWKCGQKALTLAYLCSRKSPTAVLVCLVIRYTVVYVWMWAGYPLPLLLFTFHPQTVTLHPSLFFSEWRRCPLEANTHHSLARMCTDHQRPLCWLAQLHRQMEWVEWQRSGSGEVHSHCQAAGAVGGSAECLYSPVIKQLLMLKKNIRGWKSLQQKPKLESLLQHCI